MKLVRIIREPTSLLEAESEFVRQIKRAGYVVESDLTSVWQEHVFRHTQDAVVSANVIKPERGA